MESPQRACTYISLPFFHASLVAVSAVQFFEFRLVEGASQGHSWSRRLTLMTYREVNLTLTNSLQSHLGLHVYQYRQ